MSNFPPMASEIVNHYPTMYYMRTLNVCLLSPFISLSALDDQPTIQWEREGTEGSER